MGQTQVTDPKYDFWDDPPFDDIMYSVFRGEGVARSGNIIPNCEPDDCVTACMNDINCVSFFYNIQTKICEKVPLVLMNDAREQNSDIKSSRGNRYYRYLPDNAARYCDLEKCHYFDRKANSCWRPIITTGNTADGRFSQGYSQRLCESYGGRLAVLNTLDKLRQFGNMIMNVPEVSSPTRKYWFWFWLGARRANAKEKFRWLSGEEVSLNNELWVPNPQNVIRSEKHCLILTQVPVVTSKFISPTHYRLTTHNCKGSVRAVLCEILHPSNN